MFKKRVLKRTFGRKRDEVAGEWRKLHNDELHNFAHPRVPLGRSYQGE
jgi:hypothetical protein